MAERVTSLNGGHIAIVTRPLVEFDDFSHCVLLSRKGFGHVCNAVTLQPKQVACQAANAALLFDHAQRAFDRFNRLCPPATEALCRRRTRRVNGFRAAPELPRSHPYPVNRCDRQWRSRRTRRRESVAI